MKLSTEKLGLSVAFGLGSAIAGLFAIGAVMGNEPHLAIGLGVVMAILWLVASVQLQDSRDERAREDRQRQAEDKYMYCDLIRPDWTVTTNQQRATHHGKGGDK